MAAAVADVGATNPVVLIDGRSGAGKSSLARSLVAEWPLQGRVQLVALDALYPGWGGLEAGVSEAFESILVPHARGMLGVWQRWDWAEQAPAEANAVDPALPLIVEGSGVLTARTARLGDVRVWLESPLRSRRTRALARDGESYRPHWDQWAAQEDEHVRRDEPRRLATHVFEIP
ncbi:adenylate kinase [Microbacterium terricola]|uniref:Adenylate kinase n=1 Tax=Microbacterium terricola TaxID=344163 RepID=A0ABM8DYX5_9MICO|nr:adenylate kinase [Microbacterium terricola]